MKVTKDKTVGYWWNKYQKVLAREGMSSEGVLECQKAFYSGINSMIKISANCNKNMAYENVVKNRIKQEIVDFTEYQTTSSTDSQLKLRYLLDAVKIGPFFEITVLRKAVDEKYLGGSRGITDKLGLCVESEDFLQWSTMGSDDIILQVINELAANGLNCDEESLDCDYVITQGGRPPSTLPRWLDSIEEGGQSFFFLSYKKVLSIRNLQ